MTDEWLLAQFSDCPPLGYLLRRARPHHWIRFHSLPESRRYPQSEQDWALLLARHEEMAAAVLGVGKTCVLIECQFHSEFRLGSRHVPCLDRLVDPCDQEQGWTRFGVKEFVWERACCTDILRAIADDQIRVLFISPQTGQIYAPYDGGADLFVAHPDLLRQRWPDWLSSREDGL